MSSTGAIPRTKKAVYAPPPVKTLHHDVQILVGQDASEPLDVKMLTVSSNGVQTKVPALHISWCSPRQLVHFTAPPSGGLEVPGALDAWLEQMDFYAQDLHWILELPHHRFWSELVYKSSIHKCIVSYLTNAPRWYDRREYHENQATVAPVLANIHKLVLLVHVRIATYKESKTCHITPSAFGDLLYNKYIIDMCQLLDMAALYCPSNTVLLNKMFENVFTQQPRYNDDLVDVIKSITTALANVEIRLGISGPVVPVSLTAVSCTSDIEEVQSCLTYLLDIQCTLHNFLQVYPPAALVCHKLELHIRMSSSYEHVMPVLSSSLSVFLQQEEKGEDMPRLLHLLQLLRTISLATIRSMLSSVCLEPLHTDGVSGHVINECLERYLHVVSSCLSEKTFIADYHSTYSFTKDINLFKGCSSDATSLEFLEDAVRTVLQEMGVPEEPASSSLPVINGHSEAVPRDAKNEDSSGMTAYVRSGSGKVDTVELATLVSSVTELMPHLGAGFVTKCLQHYHYSSEAVINALLEDSLPESLSSLDRSLASSDLVTDQRLSPPPPPASPVAGASVAESGYCDTYEQAMDEAKLSVLNRANIYNDDEFDVFGSATVDKSKVHRGKMKKEFNMNDEEVKDKVRVLGKAYAERQGHSVYDDEDNTLEDYELESDFLTQEDMERLKFIPYGNYNDEYDDTYDDNEAGNMDAKTEIMMPNRKRPTIFGRGALNGPLVNEAAGSEEEAEGAGGALRGSTAATLPAEENEEDFGRRRGLRKGLGGVEFMLKLREHGGEIPVHRIVHERNLPASHAPQVRRNNRIRYLPRDTHRDHHKPLYVNTCKQNGQQEQKDNNDDCDDHQDDASPAAEGIEDEQAGEAPPRLSFTPFCEDPAAARQKQAQRYASRDAARNKGGNRNRRQPGNMPPPQPLPVNGFDGRERPLESEPNNDQRGNGGPPQQGRRQEGNGGEQQQGWRRDAGRGGGGPGGAEGGGYRGKPRTYTGNSGKSWRQGTDDDASGSRGGKWKEDTNHGSAQDPNFRRKMENKNRYRKQAAQNKFNKNNT